MNYLYLSNNSEFLLIAFIASVFLVIWLRERNNLYKKRFKPLESNLFFYRDPKKDTYYISHSLRKLLDIRSNLINSDVLISCFTDTTEKELMELCYHSSEDQTLHANQAILLKIKKEISPKDTFLMCQKVLLTHKKWKPRKSYFLFFSDVTKETIINNALKYENAMLRKDLTYKNNILNSLPIPIWARNEDLKIDYFNNTYNQIIYDINTDLSNEVQELSKKESNLAHKVKKTNQLQKEEKHLVVQGTRCLYELQEAPIQGTNLSVGMGYDITSKESVKSELKMHISAQADLLESTANASAIYDSKRKLKFFNHSFVRLWGLEEKFLVTQPTYGEILEKLREKRQLPEQIDFQQFKKENLSLFTNLTSIQNDFLSLPDGRYLRVIVIPHSFGGLLFSYEDITDRLTLEKEYKTLSAVQKETIDYLNEGISVFSESGKLQISNKKFAVIWGLDETYLRSKPHIVDVMSKILIHTEEDIKNSLHEIFINNINSRKTSKLTFRKNDNATLDVLFVPLPDGATLISYHDITDSILVERTLIERNDALQDADRLKTEFLANVSYELRSPLTSIIGFSQALDKQYFGKLNELQAEYVLGINDSSQYLLTLINDILDLASIDAGYMHLEISKFNIYDTMHSIVELVQERVKETKLKFTFSCSDDIGEMSGDVKRIKQVLFKLISNSIEASKPGQKIKLDIYKKDQDIIFTVEDNGTMINAEEEKYIFNKFHKVDTKKIKSKTASLGLALVKSFVELHGGKVVFESKKVKGGIFKCIIPDYKIPSKDVEGLAPSSADIAEQEI